MNFEMLLKQNSSMLAAYVKYRVSSPADRDDLLQEISLRAYEKFPALKNEESFRPWIMTIARNMVNDWYRRRVREDTVPLDENAVRIVSVNRTVRQEVRDTLDELPAADREILYLYYWQEYSVEEIAEAMHIPQGTVKSRLYYARKHFREKYPKEETMKKKLPEIMPGYMIEKTDGQPFEVLWEELMGWFLVPKEGNALSWAIYDFPHRKQSERYDMSCQGKAEVHGLPGVCVTAAETCGKKKLTRHFIAQLTDTHCRYLAESHEEHGIRKYYTFLDGDAFLNNWGFGPENIGNEIHLKQKGTVIREGNVITSDPSEETMDVVGRYSVTIAGKTYDTVCLMDIGTYDGNTVSEQYIDRNGRTVLWRRFSANNERWMFDGFETADEDMLKDEEVLIVNGKECRHWYDCITEYIL